MKTVQPNPKAFAELLSGKVAHALLLLPLKTNHEMK